MSFVSPKKSEDKNIEKPEDKTVTKPVENEEVKPEENSGPVKNDKENKTSIKEESQTKADPSVKNQKTSEKNKLPATGEAGAVASLIASVIGLGSIGFASVLKFRKK